MEVVEVGARGELPGRVGELLRRESFCLLRWPSVELARYLGEQERSLALELSAVAPSSARGGGGGGGGRTYYETEKRTWVHFHKAPPPGDGLRPVYSLLTAIALHALGQVARSSWCSSDDDANVLDAFFYPPKESNNHGDAMGPHSDPGLVTVKPLSAVPALEVRRRSDGRWLAVEEDARARDDGAVHLVVLLGDALAELEPELTAAIHRVRSTDRPRLSLVFELRPRASWRTTGAAQPRAGWTKIMASSSEGGHPGDRYCEGIN